MHSWLVDVYALIVLLEHVLKQPGETPVARQAKQAFMTIPLACCRTKPSGR